MQKSHANPKGKLTWLCKMITVSQNQPPPTTQNKTPQLKSKTRENKPDANDMLYGTEAKERKRILFAQQFKNRVGIVTKNNLEKVKTDCGCFLHLEQALWVTFTILCDSCCVYNKAFCVLENNFHFVLHLPVLPVWPPLLFWPANDFVQFCTDRGTISFERSNLF